jgi:GNAT superfamily N-acetyltransferase
MQQTEFKTKLKDGTSILIRQNDPCIKDCIVQGFDELSAQSRYSRFFTPLKTLSDAQLKNLTDIDNINRVVVTALEIQEDENRCIGLARYFRLDEEPDVAEFALTVIDEFQKRGVGVILLKALIDRARENRIRVFRGSVLSSNYHVIRMMKSHKAKFSVEGNGSLRLDFEIE